MNTAGIAVTEGNAIYSLLSPIHAVDWDKSGFFEPDDLLATIYTILSPGEAEMLIYLHLSDGLLTLWQYHLGVSINGGTPIAGWFIMESFIKIDHLGVPPFLETPIYYFFYLFLVT